VPSKFIFVKDPAELTKLTGEVTFKLFIPRGELKLGRPVVIRSTSKGNNMIVLGFANLVAASNLEKNAPVPEGAVTTTYFKL
jgi:hypothetical protein